ncbi:DNA cytosine methyltransferase [Labrys neptuniae]|uniref:DNA (cytosine-5-)-methyltransferase n=1 Tax=Labrys neptuniae TaxID=376174 RepID=A0ABV3PFU2_9HYPH
MRELVIDSFAGGGGTSEGIKAAIGYDPDIAINHDALALAMHRVNHPGTRHMVEDVWHVDAQSMCDGAPIGLLWMSPDCKHFSKAKGGKPRNKDIRGLAWVGLRWVKSLPKRQRPRVIALENVEEFQDWGPLLADGKPCPVHKGKTFEAYINAYRSMGYVVEWRELRACDYGDPTIRKRLFVLMRRDGEPIVWPERTHGNPKDKNDAALIAAGVLKPWRTAAEIIDFSLPCPSIFETSAEIKEKLGIRANRPLADNTLARVAKGTMRYVVNSPKPFLVSINHADGTMRDRPVDEPLTTLTAKRGEALVTPFVSYAQQGGRNRDIAEPLHTITASEKDQNTLITPFVTKFNSGSTGHAVDEPLATVTSHASDTHGGGAAPLGLVAPHLMTMRNAQKPFNGADQPVHTITAGGAGLSLVAPYLVPRYQERPGQEPRTRSVEEPSATIVPGGNEGVLAAVHLSRQFGASVGAPVDEPAPTVTAGGAGKSAVVAAFLAQHNTDMIGHDVDKPLSTIVAKGINQNLIAAHMLNLRGSDRRDAPADYPLQTVSAQGNHASLVAAFLAKYYGAGEPVQAADDPLHTVTAKPRHGLVTVSIEGEPYAITDIGMRMLTPRERFSAQGFGPGYIIDHGEDEDGSRVEFTLEQQGRMCGNSVCPGMARVLVAANYQPRAVKRRPEPAYMPLLDAAE